MTTSESVSASAAMYQDNLWHEAFEFVAWEEEMFAWRAQQTIRKLETLCRDGPRLATVITDFDGVLSSVELDGIGGSNWDLLRRHMVNGKDEEHRELFRRYHPMERNGTLSFQDSKNWQVAAHKCLEGASLNDILDDATEHIHLRTGSEQFYDTCRETGVTLHIRSTAFTQIIGTVAAKAGMRFDSIAANTLVTDGTPEQRIVGIESRTLTHSQGKSRRQDHRQLEGNQKRSNVIVLGDRPHDARAVAKSHARNLLPIQVDDGRQAIIESVGEAGYQDLRQVYAEAGYDLMAVPPGLVAVDALVRAIGAAA